MDRPNRISALLAYLLLIVGWAYVLILDRKNKFAVYHTKQAMMLVLVPIFTFIAWAVFAWVVSFIPYAGAFVAASTFSLVIAVEIAVIFSWIVGLVNVIRAQTKPVPFFGEWGESLPLG